MADIRINALATTATTPASDDFLALDGTAQGTRKILATNIANNVTDVVFGTSGPSAKSSIAARAARQGLVFDGTVTAQARALTLPAVGTSDFSVSFIVNPDASVAYGGILSSINGGVFLRNLTPKILNESTVDVVSASSALTIGKFAHCVYTRSGTTGSWYINGIAAGTGTDSTNYSAAWTYLGASQAQNLEQLLVYNRALTAAEVVSLYESGVPAGADYNILPAGNSFAFTGLSAFTGYSGIAVSSVTSTSFSASGTATNPFGSGVYGSLQVRSVPGMRYRATWSFTPVSGTPPLVGLGWEGNGTWSNTVAASAGSAEFVVSTAANALKLAFITANGNTTSYSVSNITLVPLGLLLAPDAAQAGGGLTWYDTSGNAANITLPASGVSWNVPSSRVLGGNWTTSGNLTVSGGTITGGASGMSLASGGTNQNITLTPSGTGQVNFNRWVAARTTAPSSLAATSGSISFVTNGSVAGTQDTWVFDTGYTDQSYRFKVGGTDRMVIAANTGNVLVGTTTDGGQKLQVNGTASFADAVTVGGTLTVNSNRIQVGKSGSGTGGNLRCVSDDGNTRWLVGLLGAAGATNFSIYDLVNSREPLAISAAGNTTIAGDLTVSSSGTSTFAGAIAIGNTVNTVSPTSPNRTITMVIGGVTYYLHAKTTND